MSYPNCLVIGAMRSGTSTLYQLLGQHPDIFMSTPKEPNYFAFPDDPDSPRVEASVNVTDLDEYKALFNGADGERIRGEASHSYLYYSDVAAPRVKEMLDGDVKLIAILRNPVDRAFSHYMLHVRNDSEKADNFRAALELEDVRAENGEQFGHYVRRGFYAEQLRPFLDLFEPARIRIYLYEELATDAAALARDAYRFLEVDPGFVPDTAVGSNPSGIPRNRLVHAILVRDHWLKRTLQPKLPRSVYRLAARLRDRNLDRPTLDADTRAYLSDVFRPHTEELQSLIGRDLSAWLSPH